MENIYGTEDETKVDPFDSSNNAMGNNMQELTYLSNPLIHNYQHNGIVNEQGSTKESMKVSRDVFEVEMNPMRAIEDPNMVSDNATSSTGRNFSSVIKVGIHNFLRCFSIQNEETPTTTASFFTHSNPLQSRDTDQINSTLDHGHLTIPHKISRRPAERLDSLFGTHLDSSSDL